MKNDTKIEKTVSRMFPLAQFIEAIQRGEFAHETLVATGFDGQKVHVVTSAPISGGDTDEVLEDWKPEPGHIYVPAQSYNGSNPTFLFDNRLELLPNIQVFRNTLVRWMAERMRAQGLKRIEDSMEIPADHGALIMLVGTYMNGEVANVKPLERDGKKMEHCVLLDRTIGAMVTERDNLYYVPVTTQHMLVTDSTKWTFIGKFEKPVVYLSRAKDGKIVATLKGEKSHQLITGVDKLTPDNPKAAKIGSEMKGAGIFIGTAGKTNKVALFTKTEDGRRTTMIVGAKSPKAPHVAREFAPSAA